MSAWLRARLQVERDPHLADPGAVPAGGRLGQALLLVIVLVVASALVPAASVPVPAASALVPAAIVDARRAAAVLLVLGLRLALLVVEILAGLVVAVAPRFGGLLVAGWLAGVIVNLLVVGGYGDVALRDFGLLLAALTLARLAVPPGGSVAR